MTDRFFLIEALRAVRDSRDHDAAVDIAKRALSKVAQDQLLDDINSDEPPSLLAHIHDGLVRASRLQAAELTRPR